MGTIIRLKLLNFGSCNGCGVEIMDLFNRRSNFCIVEEEVKADALVVIGCLTSKNISCLNNKSVPILLVGTCAISGGAFKISDLDLTQILRANNAVFFVFGCPAPSEVIANAIEEVVRQRRRT